MEKEEKKVLFDPGYASIVIESLGQVGYIYYTFSAIPDVKLKRLNFPHTLRKLEGFLKTNIAFYLGCLLWASYISQFDNYQIEGNKLLGEDCSEEEYTDEINFLIDFVKNQLPRDHKYFLSKPYEAPSCYLKILETYKEFLIINKGFTDCSNTSQIKLPKSIKKLSNEELEKINKEIKNAVEKRNLESLFDFCEVIF